MTSSAQLETNTSVESGQTRRRLRDYEWTQAGPFVLMHLAVVGIFFVEITAASLYWCLALYLIRMFAVTGGYHRYFSHRSFKTSRVFQFILAFLAQSSAQKGALWWAAHHRGHHKYSDQPGDVHSPVIDGFWFSHIGWLFYGTSETRYDRIKDMARYPELVWLNKYHLLPPTLLGVGTCLWLGWSGFFLGFILSTILTWHATFAINSVTHVVGKRRYPTGDDSRNNWWLGLLTLGEGWHNNHHFYQTSVRQGFFWWEIDITYYVLKVLSWFGIVWDLKYPPQKILEGVDQLES